MDFSALSWLYPWTILEGELRVDFDGARAVGQAGDTLRLAAGTRRQITAATDARAIVASPAHPNVTTATSPSRPTPWAA